MAGGVRRVRKRVVAILIAIVVLVGLLAAFHYRQDIIDTFRANNFEASEELSAIIEHMELTATGERVFLATHPTLDGSQGFNAHCQSVEHAEEGHVMGCFADEGIHLFQVTDERINGIVEVTAAHELLHAAWSRMSGSEQRALTADLLEVYEDLSQDHAELATRMSVYEHLDESEFANELHSVLATEVADLPPWLEEHYARWFRDRAAVVEDFEDYHSVFTELQERADGLSTELDGIREEVEQRNADYEDAVDAFNDEVETFNQRNEDYEFSDQPEEFDRIKGELDARRAELEGERQAIQSLVDHYEELRKELESVSQQSDELDQHLNSDLAPPETRPDV